jgi:hypothetical protein
MLLSVSASSFQNANFSFKRGALIRFVANAVMGKGLEGNPLIKELLLGSSERDCE